MTVSDIVYITLSYYQAGIKMYVNLIFPLLRKLFYTFNFITYLFYIFIHIFLIFLASVLKFLIVFLCVHGEFRLFFWWHISCLIFAKHNNSYELTTFLQLSYVTSSSSLLMALK